MLVGFNDTSAYALCVFAYCEGPGHEPLVFEGRTPVRLFLLAWVEGSPLPCALGARAYGWDPHPACLARPAFARRDGARATLCPRAARPTLAGIPSSSPRATTKRTLTGPCAARAWPQWH